MLTTVTLTLSLTLTGIIMGMEQPLQKHTDKKDTPSLYTLIFLNNQSLTVEPPIYKALREFSGTINTFAEKIEAEGKSKMVLWCKKDLFENICAEHNLPGFSKHDKKKKNTDAQHRVTYCQKIYLEQYLAINKPNTPYMPLSKEMLSTLPPYLQNAYNKKFCEQSNVSKKSKEEK